MHFKIDDSLIRTLVDALRILVDKGSEVWVAKADLMRAEAELRRAEARCTKAEHEEMRREIQSLRSKMIPKQGDRRLGRRAEDPASAALVGTVMEEVDATNAPPVPFNGIRNADRLSSRG